jgi:hypothetical protein
MEIELLTDTSARLLSVINEARQNFTTISEDNWSHKPAPNKWSKKEILGHLVDSAANNHQRFVRAQLSDGPYRGPRYEQDAFVAVQRFQTLPTKDLVTLWHSYNTLLAHVIANADPSKLDVTCYIGDYDPVPLSFVMTDYVDHMVHHLEQITL